MKVRKVLFVSGNDTNAGKTTLAKHAHGFLGYANAVHIEIEDSAKPIDGRAIRIDSDEERIRELMKKMITLPRNKAILVDCGGSHFDRLMEISRSYGNLETRFDRIVYPVKADDIKEENVLANLKHLANSGVEMKRVVCVFNFVPLRDSAVSDLKIRFENLFALSYELGFSIISTPIYRSSLFEAIRGTEKTAESIAELNSEEIESMAAQAAYDGDIERAENLAELAIDHSQSRTVNANVQIVFKELFV